MSHVAVNLATLRYERKQRAQERRIRAQQRQLRFRVQDRVTRRLIQEEVAVISPVRVRF